MLGTYTLEHQGRTYFGNVSLRQHHVFAYGGQAYVANVDAFRAFPVSQHQAEAIDLLAGTPATLVPAALYEELRRLDLLSDEALTADPWSDSGERPERLVTNITLLMAQQCNLRCVYCYGDGGEYGGKAMMSRQTAREAVDWLIANSGHAEHLNICFFGGEPLLNFAVMKDAVAHAKAKGAEAGKRFTFTVTTNGTVLSEEIIAFLRREDVRPMVSFDGPPEYHNRNRPFRNGRGSYGRVHANLQKLRAALLQVAARGIVCDDQDPRRVKEGAAAAGFSECSVGMASPVLHARGVPARPAHDPGRIEAVERMLCYKRQLIDELLAQIRARSVSVECPPTLLHALYDLADGKLHHYGCGMGRGLVGISASGDIFPCHRFIGQADMKMGHISNYKAGGLNDYSRAIVDRLPECGTCWARYWCGGGCFYRNKALRGDLHTPDRLDCLERKTQIEGLLHVQCQLSEGDRAYLQTIREQILRSRGLRSPAASSGAASAG